MPNSTSYIKWIREALQANPRITQSGLARHLGKDRSVVSNILTGKRAIKAGEIERIAAYLGVSPPGLPQHFVPVAAIREISVMGRLSRSGDWHESGRFHPQGRSTVPGIPDERFPFEDQIGFEVASSISADIDNASHVVAVSAKQYRPTPIVGDLYIVEKRQGPLVSHHAARAVRKGDKVVLTKLDDTIEPAAPDWFVIMTLRVRV